MKTDVPATLVPASADGVFKDKRVYFGHQSVGYNIADGLKGWIEERPALGVKLLEAKSPESVDAGTFAHGPNGENEQPLKKIADFAATLDAGLGQHVDVAFFKFCYVDITPDTDVEGVFEEYKKTLSRLGETYPDTKFVHFTVPLTVVESGAKASLKKLVGRKLMGVDANIARHRYNELVRAEYQDKGAFFDLAEVESTHTDGTPVRFNSGGASYPALAPEYASDGKHLNDVGARWVAGHLLKTLAELSS